MIAVLAVWFCAAMSQSADNPLLERNHCGAADLQQFIGDPVTVLETRALPERTRILRPNDLATTDFVTDRLNVTLDEADIITAAYCG